MTLPSDTPPANDKTTVIKLEIVLTIAVSPCSCYYELLKVHTCFLVYYFLFIQ